MKKIINPKQIQLFDPFDSVLTPKTRKRLLDGWAGVFRHIILELMPVDAVSEHFDPAMGRPTKELYSVAEILTKLWNESFMNNAKSMKRKFVLKKRPAEM